MVTTKENHTLSPLRPLRNIGLATKATDPEFPLGLVVGLGCKSELEKFPTPLLQKSLLPCQLRLKMLLQGHKPPLVPPYCRGHHPGQPLALWQPTPPPTHLSAWVVAAEGMACTRTTVPFWEADASRLPSWFQLRRPCSE